MKNVIAGLQPIGRALMLPIAVLPVAALLLRIGQPDLLDLPMVAAAGQAIFSNLGLLFAIGVAVGLARENHGAAGLASVVCYVVATRGAEVLIEVPAEVTAELTGRASELAAAAFRSSELARFSVPTGLVSGLIAGGLYNRYSDIRLPSYLAFFGGRRFVPIASGCAGLLLALALGWGWQHLERGMDAISQAVLRSNAAGLFVYGVLNRVLIVTGLHHILNNIAWFLLGDYHGTTGDLQRFFAGDPDAGAFMAGFFPVMMFGLPAACLAMYHTVPPARRKAAGGLLLSMALTSLLTGVTEPIEFSFMFLAPVLYAVHAVLTGFAMVIMALLDVRLGFSFSAGLFDYALTFSQASRPLMLIPVGLVYAALYYGLFRYFIVRLNLKTPGREGEMPATGVSTADVNDSEWIQALGGAGNLASVDACTTRLRLIVEDQQAIDEAALRRLGARAVVRPSAQTVQVVVGPTADQLASRIRAGMKMGEAGGGSPALTERPGAPPPHPGPAVSAEALLRALGGRGNVRELTLAGSRLCLTLADAAAAENLEALPVRGIARPAPQRLHVVLGPAAPKLFEELNRLGAGAAKTQ